MGDVTKEKRESIRSCVNESLPNQEHSQTDILLQIPMKPRGKQRARGTVKNGRTMHYTPKTTRDFERDFAEHARRQMPGKKLCGLLRIEVVAFIQRPKRLMRKRDPEGPLYCPVTPDADNILKSCIDSLAWAMEKGDQQVARASCVKLYSEMGGQARMLIRIRSLEQDTTERQTIQRVMFNHV